MSSTAALEKQAMSALGRPERKIPLEEPKAYLHGKRILVTGAAGSLGSVLVPELWKLGATVISTDIEDRDNVVRLDVRDFSAVLQAVRFSNPELIIHLAAEKLAPRGEIHPYQTASTNIDGTQNVVNTGVPVVYASTCKAGTSYCTYGLSKMIAERLVLNAGGTVVRYYNVPAAGPSMLSIWNALPADEPIPVTPCWRYLITWREAIASTLWACTLEPGRYAVDPGASVAMTTYAQRLFPNRKQRLIEPRRGDSERELLHSPHETIKPTRVPFINKIVNPNDADY